MQEYCYAFFKIGTPHCFEAFKELSEKMLGYYPDNTVYMTNIGSYYLVYKHDSKAALKMYNKVLKKSPDDYTAIKNCVLLARSDKNIKLEKKYASDARPCHPRRDRKGFRPGPTECVEVNFCASLALSGISRFGRTN